MTHDLEFDDFIVYFENPWNKQIEIKSITDFEGNKVHKNERELKAIHTEIRNHCEINDWFGNANRIEYGMEWMQQNHDFDKHRGIE